MSNEVNVKIPDSERLSFSLMTNKDASLLFELDQDKAVMQFINGGKMTSKQDIENIYVPRMEGYTKPSKGWGLWKVVVKNTGNFIGWILVRPMDFYSNHPQDDNLELGWRFKQESWGKGYATEAANRIKAAIVSESRSGSIDNIRCFSAIALEDNNASIKIMKKLGMKYIKTDILRDPLGDSEVVFYATAVR